LRLADLLVRQHLVSCPALLALDLSGPPSMLRPQEVSSIIDSGGGRCTLDRIGGTSRALCYPWINIPAEKAANLILYWDSLSTIAPAFVKRRNVFPPSIYSDTSRLLIAEDLLKPVSLGPYTEIQAAQRTHHLVLEMPGSNHAPLIDELDTVQAPLDWQVNGGYLIHASKAGPEAFFWLGKGRLGRRSSFARRGGRFGDKVNWVPMPKDLATLYLTAVCAIEAKDRRMPLVASYDELIPWVDAVRSETQLSQTVTIGKRRIEPEFPAQEFEHGYQPEAILADFTIQAITFGSDVPLDKAIAFRRKHWDLLARYRTEVVRLANEVLGDASDQSDVEELLQFCIKTRIKPVLEELKKARSASRLSAGSDMIMATGYSVSPGLLAMAAGHPLAGQIITAAGLTASVAINGVRLYRTGNNRAINNSPLSYLFVGKAAFANPKGAGGRAIGT